MASQKEQLLPITIKMYGKTANLKFTTATYNIGPYQLNKIQVARGNCNYLILKAFNMKDMYLDTIIAIEQSLYNV